MREGAQRIAAAVAGATLLMAAGCTATGDGSATAAMPQPPIEGGASEGVTVAGSGVATGEPDVVRVTVGVEVEREDVQTALDDANAATEQVIETLDDQGVDPEDRQTRDFSVNPVQRDDGDGNVELAGYGVRNLVEATVRDVGRVGAVVQAATEAAGDDASVQGVQFDLEDDGEQLVAAREAALEDARDKAAQYAELTGSELGEVVGIEDQTVSSPRQAESHAMGDDAALDQEAAVPVEPGEQDVTVQVTVRWSLDG